MDTKVKSRKVLVTALILILTLFSATTGVFGLDNISLKGGAIPETITIEGKAAPNVMVSIAITDGNDNVVYFQGTRADADSNYKFTPDLRDNDLPLYVTVTYENTVETATIKAENNSTPGTSSGSGGATGKTETIEPEEAPLESATPGNGVFSDVTGHWAAEYINDLAGRGLLKGKTETLFAPNAKITRAEFITILARMSDADLSVGKATKFSDVPSNAWFSAAVAWGTENGVISGVSEMSFAPNAYITREQAAAMILRYCQNVRKIALPEINEPLTFQDQNSIADYAKEAVSAMQKAGVITGKPGNLFAPKDNATRAEVSKIVYTILQFGE